MKIHYSSLKKIAFTAIVTLTSGTLFLPQASQAQIFGTDTQAGYDQQPSNSCTSAGSEGFNMFNLIHCANLRGNGWDKSEQGEDFNSAIADFQKIQQQRIQGTTTTPNNSNLGIITLPSPAPQSK
ncbi:hypothetical protein [Calothrix sp. 336/3]|uniref:hypothetical protein n=1 Tax=Calothrix sp. 336/3 TaxID=1337936 RepID=UPI0004E429C1|nr:hypothetical protein [Calothrix sp. 336/3]AKG23862.1 hypothetical protein IJ00_23460 [Calothrix sp. 336/3]